MTDTQTTTTDGTFEEVAGRPGIRFERTYPHPIARVWQTLTDADETAEWFPSRIEIEPRAGGVVRFLGSDLIETSTGAVLAYEAPTTLAFEWGDDEIHVELTAASASSTRLVLRNVLGDRLAAARNCAGWETCLGNLGRLLDGETTRAPHLSGQWDVEYDRYVAAGVPNGAPVPGRG